MMLLVLKYIFKKTRSAKNERNITKKSVQFLNKTGMQIGLHPLLYIPKRIRKKKTNKNYSDHNTIKPVPFYFY